MTKKGIELGKSAAGTIDELKTELLVKQQDLINLINLKIEWMVREK